MTVYTDNFTGTDGSSPAAPWVTGVLGTTFLGYVQIQSNTLEMNQNNAAYNGQYANWGTSNIADFDVTFTITWPAIVAEAYPGLGFRMSGGTNGWESTFAEVQNGYVCYLNAQSSTIVMDRETGGGADLNLGSVGSKGFTANSTHAVRVRAVGTSLQAKCWNTTGGEPGTWDISATNSTYTTGLLGLRGQAAVANTKTRFDNWSFDDLVAGGTLSPPPYRRRQSMAIFGR